MLLSINPAELAWSEWWLPMNAVIGIFISPQLCDVDLRLSFHIAILVY